MKKINILWVCLWCTFQIFAQNFTDIQTVIPPSPEAASLGKYGEFPVNLYTGQAQLSVPIYTIEAEGMQVPISLSYSTTGVKVSEMASRAGLGWSLNAGGVVTRVVKERPDDGMQTVVAGEYDTRCDGGFLNGGDNPFLPFGSDQERDVFYFNFAGYSGKFMFKDKDHIVFFPHSNLKIEIDWEAIGGTCPHEKIEAFHLTTPEGIRYSFTEVENAFTSPSTFYRASWFLSEINHPNGSTIQLSYNNLGQLSLPDQVMRMYEDNYPEEGNCQCEMDTTNVTQQLHSDVKVLREITFTDGKVVFSGTPRQDWLGDQTIDQIEVFYKNKKVKDYQLVQSYFQSPGGSTPTHKRLKLDAIKELGEGTEEITLYKFDYNQEMTMPHRLSNEIDAWGYYNANGAPGENTLADSEHLKPRIYFYPNEPDGHNFWIYPREGYNGVELIYEGADKRSNEPALKAGILEAITYPTGGRTRFNYELHEFIYQGYPIRGGGLRLKSQTDIVVNGTDIYREYAYIKTDGTSSGAVTEIPQFAFLCSAPPNDIDNCLEIALDIDEIYVNPQDPQDSRYSMTFDLDGVENGDISSVQITTSQGTETFYTASGTIWDTYDSEEVEINIQLTSGCSFTATDILVAGGPPVNLNLCDSGQSVCPSLADYHLRRYNLDQNKLGDFCGSPLGYSRVLEIFPRNGYVEYQYNNPALFPDVPPTITVDEEVPSNSYCLQQVENLNGTYEQFPFGTGYDQSHQRGLLTQKRVYDETDNVLVHEWTQYDFQQVDEIPIDVSTIFIPDQTQALIAEVFIRSQGTIGSYIVTPQYTTVINNGVSYSQSFQYNTFTYADGSTKYHLSAKSITNSDGQVFTTNYAYANDLNDNLLYNEHMIGIPLEIHSPGGAGAKTLYQQVGNRILPYRFFTKGYQANICSPAIHNGWKLEGSIEEYDGIYPKRVSHPCETGEQILTWADSRLQHRQFIDQHWDYTYNDRGLVSKTVDENGQLGEFFYDDFERLEQNISRGGAIVTDISYGLDLINGGENYVSTNTTMDVPVPASTTYVDGLGRMYKEVLTGYTYEQEDLEVSTSYDAMGRTTAQCDPRQGACITSAYEASPLGRVIRAGAVGWPRQIEQEYRSEDNYLVHESIDENGHSTVLLTDVLGRTHLSRQFLDGNPVETSYTYDDRGNILTITQPNNETFIYTYYPDGKLHTEKVPGKGLVSYEYNERDLLWKVTDAKGNMTETLYDEYGRVDAVLLEGTGTISDLEYYSYTAVPGQKGMLEYQQDLILGTTDQVRHTYTYDSFGRVQTQTYLHPLGTDQMSYVYNHRDQVEEMTRTTHEGKAIFKDYTYDHAGRLISISMTVDGHTELLSLATYNERDWVTKDQLGGISGNFLQEIGYTYNGRGWLKKIGSLGECIDITVPQDPDPGNEATLTYEEGSVELLYNASDLANSQPTAIALIPNLDGYSDTTLVFSAVDSLIIPKGSHGMQQNFTNTETITFTGSFDVEVLSTLIANKVVNDVSALNSDLSTTALVNQNYFKEEVHDALKNFNYDEDCGNNLLFAEEINYLETLYALNDSPQYNGNIASVRWRAMGRDFTANYGFQYDELNRLQSAHYGEHDLTSNGAWQNENRYSTQYSYDIVGNLTHIERQGLVDDSGSQGVYGTIDDLTLNYSAGILQSVSEGADPLRGYLGNGSSYGYDLNGNTIQAPGIPSIKYNHLNLPSEIELSGGGILVNFYDAAGNKVKKEYTAPMGSTTEVSYLQHYIGGIEYRDGSIESIQHEKGRYVYLDGTGYHEYSIRDHNGSPRVFFVDVDGDGSISLDPTDEEVRQEQHYYPFGMSMEGMGWLQPTTPNNHYRYTGQEQSNFGWYDYGARWYDPVVGRMMQVDPAAAEYSGWSPYNYVLGNPLRYTDPTGMYVEEELNGRGHTNDREKRTILYDENGNATGVHLTYSGNDSDDDDNIVKAFFSDADGYMNSQRYLLEGEEDCCPPWLFKLVNAKIQAELNGTNIFVEYKNPEEDLIVALEAASLFIAPQLLWAKFGRFYKAGNIAVKGGGKLYSQATFKAFQRQLQQHGRKSILKSQSKIMKKLQEHLTKLDQVKKTGGYTSSIEREIRTFKSQLQAIDDLLK